MNLNEAYFLIKAYAELLGVSEQRALKIIKESVEDNYDVMTQEQIKYEIKKGLMEGRKNDSRNIFRNID